MESSAASVKTMWAIDPTHSEVQFKVKHLVISTVTGLFRSFRAEMESDGENFDGARVSFELDVDSIDTNVEARDNHLKSDDFFAADAFPVIRFEGELRRKEGDSFVLAGPLTIRDITRVVEMNADFGGIMVDPYGNTKAGFEVSGKLNRKEFGLMWDAVTEAGGVVVADEIRLNINVQMVLGQS